MLPPWDHGKQGMCEKEHSPLKQAARAAVCRVTKGRRQTESILQSRGFRSGKKRGRAGSGSGCFAGGCRGNANAHCPHTQPDH